MSYMIEKPISALQSRISKIIDTRFLNHLFCSDPSEELCHEKKALYKLISGLHSSISVHIAYDYLLDESTNMVCAKNCTHQFFVYWAKFCNCFDHFLCKWSQWGQNLPLLYDRVLKYPERVQNLYFTYLFVLRAVTKVPVLPYSIHLLYTQLWKIKLSCFFFLQARSI